MQTKQNKIENNFCIEHCISAGRAGFASHTKKHNFPEKSTISSQIKSSALASHAEKKTEMLPDPLLFTFALIDTGVLLFLLVYFVSFFFLQMVLTVLIKRKNYPKQ